MALALMGIALIGMAGCTFNEEEQRRFEQQAFSDPRNFTRTDSRGIVTSNDGEDWRISPFYEGLITVDPAFPNPSTTMGRFEIHVMVGGLDAMNGLMVLVHEPGIATRVVWTKQETPLSPGLHVIRLNPLELSRLGTVEGARGLHRVVVTDLKERVLTYGDLMVE